MYEVIMSKREDAAVWKWEYPCLRDTFTLTFYTCIPQLYEEEIVLCFGGNVIWIFGDGGGTGMILPAIDHKIQQDMAKLWQEKSPEYQNRGTVGTADPYKLDDYFMSLAQLSLGYL